MELFPTMTPEQRRLCEIVQKKGDEIYKGIEGARYSMHEGVYFARDDRHAAMYMEVGMPDGTVNVYYITAYVNRDNSVSTRVRQASHNNEDYWNKMYEADQKRLGRVAIINNTHYTIAEQRPDTPASCKGFGGQRFRIRFNDGRVVETDDLWYQGPIPPVFRDKFPNNAEWA